MKAATKNNSIFRTQDALHKIEARRRSLVAQLAEVDAQLAAATREHRAQILRSVRSSDPDEARAARSIATWWEVPLPSAD